jgi:hypothetical protein
MLALELKDDECFEDFEEAGMVTRAYTLGVFVAQYIVPLAIIVVCYIRWVVFIVHPLCINEATTRECYASVGSGYQHQKGAKVLLTT